MHFTASVRLGKRDTPLTECPVRMDSRAESVRATRRSTDAFFSRRNFRLGRCVPPLRHHFRGVSAVVAGDHAMTSSRARAGDEGDDLSCPSDPVACLGPVRPAPRLLLARRRGHSGVQTVHAGKAARRMRVRAFVAAPAVLDVRRYGVYPRDVLREKTRMRPVLVPAHLAGTDAEMGSSRTSPCSASWASPTGRAVRDLLGADAVVDAARLNGTNRGLPRLRAQRAGRATRKEGALSDNGPRLRGGARAGARPALMATLSARIASPWTGWRPRTRTARVQSRSRETRARACCAR